MQMSMFYAAQDEMFSFFNASARPATLAEADAQYVAILGPQRPQQAWILSDRDVWYRNPAYRGPSQPHPED